MKKKYFILIFIIMFLIFKNNVNAYTYGGCEYSKVSRLKSLVSNVNLSYDYYISDGKAYFNVTINNIVPEIYFIDSKTLKRYDFTNTNDGEITITGYNNQDGIYKFYSNLPECNGIKLGNKFYSFPYYNSYYDTDICRKNSSYTLCKKWKKVTISYQELEKKINTYNEQKKENEQPGNPSIVYKKTALDYFVEFYVKYYYIMLIGIIVVCVTVMIISTRKNRFDI